MKEYTSFLFSFIAGMSTIIGYLFIYYKKSANKIINFSLAFSAGVMLSVCIFDLIPETLIMFNNTFSKLISYIIIFFFILMGTMFQIIIDKHIKGDNNLYRIGILSMVTIIIHNIPEGIITFLSASSNVKIGFLMCCAIAFHNIPEGLSIAIPIYFSTKSKKKAFIMVLLSALSEPFGALLCYLFLKPFINELIIALIYSLVCGIMISISLFKLMPEALIYNEKKKTFIFFLLGFFIMYISIIMLNYNF